MTTKNDITVTAESLDDIVFEGRNKEYGAYYIRKRYNRFVIIAFVFAFLIVTVTAVTPLIESYYSKEKNSKKLLKNVTMEMDKLEKEEAPPPPPPPPPPEAVQEQVKFKAPVVVDTVKDEVQIASNDDIVDNTSNDAAPTEIVVEEKHDKVVVEEEPIFVSVEENATFQGGSIESFRNWVAEHLKFPESAQEMGLEGKVIVQFVVNSKGLVERVAVMRGVDPVLDEAVVKTIQGSPKWTPGKQGGKAVKQQFVIPVNFKLNK
jgi:protein TonB